jgi:hypothetical protein
MLRAMGSARRCHPPYLSPWTTCRARPSIEYGARARGSAAGHSRHSAHPAPGPDDTPDVRAAVVVAPHRPHHGGAMRGRRCQHSPQTGARVLSTPRPQHTHTRGRTTSRA